MTRLEILGAWLGIWTPPRDAVIPPVPWPRLALGALVVLLVAGAAAVVAVPRLERSKDERAAREHRAEVVAAAARRARLRREQATRRGHSTATGRAAVLADVREAIARDARARFSPRAGAPDCAPAAGTDGAAGRLWLDCYAPTSEIVAGGDQEGARGTIAIPFRAVVDVATGRFVFCKVNPPPGEQSIPDPRRVVELPRACRLPRS